MKSKTLPFTGTPEQAAELKKVIAELKDQPGALMPIMQKAQDIYGYLPIEVQKMIADGTGSSTCSRRASTACRSAWAQRAT